MLLGEKKRIDELVLTIKGFQFHQPTEDPYRLAPVKLLTSSS